MQQSTHMNRNTRLFSGVAIFLGVYVASFIGYRWWADSIADTRPRGLPAWYFMYPTRTVPERAVYWLFYPCIRIDQIAHDAAESPNV